MRPRFGCFERSVRLLMVNQFAINIGFFMLMPYVAGHLSGGLGLAGWTVGLVLGARNLSQQGLFLLGGTLADRLGYRPVIIAGSLLRTAGFALLGFVDTVPALVAASAMTGFAGALFNPAVRAYLAHDSGAWRVEAFALFNVFCQAGTLIGPLIGLVLVTVDFRLVCGVAAAVFALLTMLQLLALPPRRVRTGVRTGVLADWRAVAGNRPFVLFSLAMTGSYVLSFQVYLALPLELGDTGAVGLLFVVSGLVAVAGQVGITGWARRRWSGPQAIVRGLVLMALGFVPLTLCGAVPALDGLRLAAAIVCTVLLALGSVLTYPFEMDTVVTLSGERLVATHYGLYNTVAGIGVTAGNLLVGTLLDSTQVWIMLAVVGSLCALAVSMLNRGGVLPAGAVPAQANP